MVPYIAEELGTPLDAFGTVLSAGLFGLIIVSAFVFGIFSLLTPQADAVPA